MFILHGPVHRLGFCMIQEILVRTAVQLLRSPDGPLTAAYHNAGLFMASSSLYEVAGAYTRHQQQPHRRKLPLSHRWKRHRWRRCGTPGCVRLCVCVFVSMGAYPRVSVCMPAAAAGGTWIEEHATRL
eukprot:GHVU01087883.1.p1 GENE.GHVU01087883.1~~GHVU01087883.1.p1  ORF type:complete len:128 (+),score=0.84 GHVU01087883.1:640-1023(+)